MSIFIIIVLGFVYFYCSALEAAMEPIGGFNGNYYDSDNRQFNRFCNSHAGRAWNGSNFK